MTDVWNPCWRVASRTPAVAVFVLLAVLLVGCSSSGRRAQARPAGEAGAAVAPEATPVRQISAMELRQEDPSTLLELAADGRLVWTSFRDADGNLIIELPNSQPESDLADLGEALGLIASVDVELDEAGSRPLTRLTVRTREEAEHALEASGNRLLVQLTPIADTPPVEDRVAEVPPPPAEAEPGLSYEPLPDEDPPVVSEIDIEPRSEEPSTETFDDPSAGSTDTMTSTAPSAEAVAANPASLLEEIEVVSIADGTVIQVRGDGRFTYSSFELSDPQRFVIDLEGVVNSTASAAVAVDSELVERVRVAQFKPFPEPVSRVVFDLRTAEAPIVESNAQGLLVRFGSGALSAAAPSITEPETEAFETASADSYGEPAATDPEPQETYETTSSDEPVFEEPAAEDQVAETTPVSYETESVPPPVVESYDPEPTPTAEDQVAAIGTTETTETTGTTETTEPWEAPAETTEEPATTADSDLEASVQAAWADEGAEGTEGGETVTTAAPVWEEPVETAQVETPPAPVETTPASGGDTAEPLVTSDVALFEAAEVQYTETRTAERQDLTTEVESEVVGSNGRVYSGPPISMSLKDADIKDVIRSFSGFTDLNFVVHPGVRGSVTVELTDVPWDQALDLILRINNLDFVLEGSIMRIATTEQLEAEAQARRKLAAARAQQIPLQTVIRAVSYADATQIAQLLVRGAGGGGRNNSTNSILSRRGSISVDQRTNKLIIKELPSNMNAVLAIIENLDTAEPQVLIEARIVETTKQFSRSLGINWSFNGVADEEFGNSTGLLFPNSINSNGGVQLLTGGANGFLNISLGNVLDTFTLDTSLQAAENEGLVSILSAPKIATLNNQQANIQSGLQIPVQTVANNTVSVQFVNATLQLQVTPQVTAEGTVLMDIDIAKREPQLAFAVAGASNAPISTKQARTRVIVRDGGTTVIGGIYEVSSNRGEDRVPGLANVPILGHLFKNKRRNNDNEELLIFITPRVIQL